MITDITPLLLNITVFMWTTVLLVIWCLWHIYFSNNDKLYKNMMYGYPVIAVVGLAIMLLISFLL